MLQLSKSKSFHFIAVLKNASIFVELATHCSDMKGRKFHFRAVGGKDLWQDYQLDPPDFQGIGILSKSVLNSQAKWNVFHHLMTCALWMVERLECKETSYFLQDTLLL